MNADCVPQLNIAQRDMSQVLDQLKQQLPIITDGAWTDFTQEDIGWATIKTHAALYDFTSYFSDQNLSEAFLQSCIQYESAVRRAKELNYPYQMLGPATVSVQLTNSGLSTEVIIPANSSWTINGIPFTNENDVTIPAFSTSQNITLTQGSFYSVTATASGVDWFEIDLPQNAANITVYVNSVEWTGGDSFVDVPTPQFYKIYRNTTGPSVVFGDHSDPSIITAPNASDQVVVNMLLTLGDDGNIYDTGVPVILISVVRDQNNNDVTRNFTGTTLTNALGGTPNEPIESIRENAPQFYATQGRCVADVDYTAFVKTVPGVTDALCIGGQELNDYGSVYIFLYGGDPYTLTDDLISAVTTALQSKFMVTMNLKFVLPTVVGVSLNMTIGVSSTNSNDLSTVFNSANSAVTAFTTSMTIGQSLYTSDIASVVKAINLVKYVDFTWSLSEKVLSQAGLIQLPLITNYDVSNATLLNASGGTIASGNLGSYVSGNQFNYTDTAIQSSDQNVTLNYRNLLGDDGGNNILIQNLQLVYLNSLNINTLAA